MKSIIWILGAAGVIAGCGSSSKPPAFRSFEEVSQGELGQCCTTCRGSLRVDSDGALTYSVTGTVTCHGQLTTSETAAFASLVTRADVVQALAKPPACGDGSEEMTLVYDDGTMIDDPGAACPAAPSPLLEIEFALNGYVTEYCSPLACASDRDAAPD